MEATAKLTEPEVRERAAELRAWLDASSATREVSAMEAWERALSSRGGLPQGDARRVLSAGLAMPEGSGFPEPALAPLKEALRDALRGQCDGTWPDEGTSTWTLSVGPGDGIEAFVDALARDLFPRLAALAACRPGDAAR